MDNSPLLRPTEKYPGGSDMWIFWLIFMGVMIAIGMLIYTTLGGCK